jgi:hypothetical protein
MEGVGHGMLGTALEFRAEKLDSEAQAHSVRLEKCI